MSIYLDKTLGKWRATYNYCGVKYRIPGLYMSRDEALQKWTELDGKLMLSGIGSDVERQVFKFIEITKWQKYFKEKGLDLTKINLYEIVDIKKIRKDYKNKNRDRGIMYETFLYNSVINELNLM